MTTDIGLTPEITGKEKKMGLWDYMSTIGTGMSLLGTSMIDPAKGTALTQQVIERQEKQKNIPEMYNAWKSKATFDIWNKYREGKKLEQWEKDFADIKDPKEPPSEMDLWKQAERETLSAMGGSSMMGLSKDKLSKYYPGIEGRFLDLKKQFGLQTKEDQIKRARRTLREKGFADTPEATKIFLTNNPNF